MTQIVNSWKTQIASRRGKDRRSAVSKLRARVLAIRHSGKKEVGFFKEAKDHPAFKT
jgi:hypothetical protein